ncbi:nephrin [Nephila pilipes]|uniref:Nephrin n=1 Tax=Nephila pilipes TaxID=299642 RepID=A0A8X6NBZ5_NEPPI|nr:nephrin [Nephila pilipes]
MSKTTSQATGSAASDDEVLREKMVKKIPSEDHSPFYLTGTSVDMPVDGLDVDTFQVMYFTATSENRSTFQIVFVNAKGWYRNSSLIARPVCCDDLLLVNGQKPAGVKLHQVSRDSSEDGQSSGRRCDCGGRQWSKYIIMLKITLI